jgi:hypothetical protein
MIRVTRVLLTTAAVMWLILFGAGCYMNQGYLPVDIGAQEDVQHAPRGRSSGGDTGGGSGSCH